MIDSEFADSALYLGKPIFLYTTEVRLLKRAGKYHEAVELLINLIDLMECQPGFVNPWFYEHLAIVYRKLKEPEKEHEILNRFLSQRFVRDAKSDRVLRRLPS